MKNAKTPLFISLILSLLLWTCQSKVEKPSSVDSPAVIFAAEPNQVWKKAVNNSTSSLADLYVKNAIKIFPNGAIIAGNNAIDSSYKNRSFVIDSIQIIKNVVANKKRGINYEIGDYWIGKQAYKQLIIWNTIETIQKRELEFIAKSTPSPSVLEEINLSRKKWIALCNQHNAAQLVAQVYTPNAIYYNHKPAIIGREGITAEYQYMNQEKYSLHLEPIIVETVTPELVFEIGQCAGSYQGKYMIIWQKQENGDWQVLMDSNI